MPKKVKEEPVTAFEVSSSGTLTMADFEEFTIRSDFYESAAQSWADSPAHLADAMDECPPLAWAVHSIYSEAREEIQSDLDKVIQGYGVFKKRIAALKARLEKMPEEPNEGAEAWLLSLTSVEFEARVTPEIEKWFESPPNWNWEDDYLPREATAQGAAMEFFQSMDGHLLDAIGVRIVEGEHPGSTYYAAELTSEIKAANKAAAGAGVPVRFKKAGG